MGGQKRPNEFGTGTNVQSNGKSTHSKGGIFIKIWVFRFS